jgi:hypothetical protein
MVYTLIFAALFPARYSTNLVKSDSTSSIDRYIKTAVQYEPATRKKFSLRGRKLTKSGAQQTKAKTSQKTTFFVFGEKQRIKPNKVLPM